MKQTALVFFFTFVAVTVQAQFIFRISSEGLEKPSFILGTIHVLAASLLDSVPDYQEAEAQCQQMYVEHIPTEEMLHPNIESFFQQEPNPRERLKYPDGKNIFNVIDKESADILKEKFKEIIPINLDDPTWKEIWSWQPADFQEFFLVPIRRQRILSLIQGAEMAYMLMDFELMQRAKERGWQVFGLDDENKNPKEMISAQFQTPPTIEAQADSLMAFLKNYEERKAKLIEEPLVSCNFWKARDFEGFTRYYLPQVTQQTVLLKDRNETWLPKILRALREKPTLFVFGAAHLIGDYGIIHLLTEAGCRVEQIKE